MGQVLCLFCKVVVNINSGDTSRIDIGNVNGAIASSGSYTRGKIYKSEYLRVAGRILAFIEIYNRAPNYASTSLGRISFKRLIYMYSRILDFYGFYGRLPNYVTI